MDRRAGKIRDAAGVIEVEVGQQDVAHVLGLEPQFLHLLDRRVHGVEPHPGEPAQQAERRRRGCAMSALPNRESTSTSPPSASTSRQWQPTSGPPSGCIVPQLR